MIRLVCLLTTNLSHCFVYCRKKHQGLIQQHRKDLKHLGDQVEDLRKLSLGSQPQNGAADGGSIGSYCEVTPERLASDIFPIGTLTSSWFKVIQSTLGFTTNLRHRARGR